MKRILNRLSLLLLLSVALALGTSSIHATTATISDESQKMATGSCQAACSVQSKLGAPAVNFETDNKDIEPDPTADDYLAFIGVGWFTLITVSAAYLLRFLRRLPPDLLSLHSILRI